MRAADRLARLPLRLYRDGAGIDDDGVLKPGRGGGAADLVNSKAFSRQPNVMISFSDAMLLSPGRGAPRRTSRQS